MILSRTPPGFAGSAAGRYSGEPTTGRKGDWGRATLACMMFALLLCGVSNNLHGRFASRSDVIQQQFSLLDGRPLPFGTHTAPMKMWRNRILFPFLLAIATRVSALTASQWYTVVRFATAVVALMVFWGLVRGTSGGSPVRALIGSALLTYMLLFTLLSFTLDVPSDFPDAALAAGSLWAVLKRKRAWILLLAAIGAANRESAAFAGVMWLCVHGFSPTRKGRVGEWAFAAGLSAGAYIVVTALRHVFGGQFVETPQVFAFVSIKFWLTGFLRHPSLDGWPLLAIAMWGLPAMVIWPHRRQIESIQVRLLVAAGLMAAITATFGAINELRVFIPSIVTVAYVACTLRPVDVSPQEDLRPA